MQFKRRVGKKGIVYWEADSQYFIITIEPIHQKLLGPKNEETGLYFDFFLEIISKESWEHPVWYRCSHFTLQEAKADARARIKNLTSKGVLTTN
jgi:hypothetical protein